MRRAFSLKPTHWIYLLTHASLVLVGLVMILVAAGGDGLDAAVLFAIGASVTAAGLAGWVVFAYVLVSEATARRLEVLRGLGIEDAFTGRAVRIKDEYDRRIKDARNRIDVIGFGLRSLREDYKSEFVMWKEHASVRVLLIDPDFPRVDCALADQRDREEDDSPGSIREQVMNFVRDAAPALEPGRFELRLYTCLPAVNIFRVDDELFWGPYLVRELSRNAPTILVARGGDLFDRLVVHFDRIWRDPDLSRPVPAEWLATA